MNYKKIQRLCLIAFIILFSIIQINGQNTNLSKNSKLIEEYKTFINTRIEKDKLVGVGAALILGDSIIWKEGFGFADKDNNIPFTTKTTLCIGSITKPITALGIMQLYEKGLIDIDKPLVNYLPQFSIKSRQNNIREITVKSVMDHYSGLPNDISLNAWVETEKYTDAIRYLKNEYLGFPVGMINHYSNIGYCLLGHAIFNISGTDYPLYIQKNILYPIGMTNSGFKNSSKLNFLSKTYDNNGTCRMLKDNRHLPAGMMYSNIDDMTKFAQELIAIYNGKKGSIIQPQTLNKIFSEQENETILDNDKNGLGWILYKNDSCFAVVFTGSTHVSNASIIIVPQKRMAAVFLANTVGGLSFAFDGIKKLLNTVGLNENDNVRSNLNIEKSINALDVSVDSLKKHIGVYADTRSSIEVKLYNNKLMLIANFGQFILSPITQNEFSFSKIINSDSFKIEPNQKFIFTDAKDYHFLFWQDKASRLHSCGFRLNPQLISDTWKKRLGKYKISGYKSEGYDNISEAELSVAQNNLLQLKLLYSSGQYIYNMYIQSANELIFCGTGETGGETLTFSKSKQKDIITLFGLTFGKDKLGDK